MLRIALCLLLCLLVATVQAAPIPPGFTYQGRLQDGAQPANGLFDFEFRLYDTVSGPTQIGTTVTLEDVPVEQGVFSVLLNFPGGAFIGDGRWLAISVRDGASAGVFDLLSPRQTLTATPYAQYALSGNPGPTGPAGTTGQDVFTTYSSAALTVTPTTGAATIPGMTLTVNVPASSKVLISTYGGMQTTSTIASTGFSAVEVFIFVDGALLPNAGRVRLHALNNGGLTGAVESWSMTAAPVLSAGSHTITVRSRGLGIGSDATLGGDAASVLRGELNLTVIKQ